MVITGDNSVTYVRFQYVVQFSFKCHILINIIDTLWGSFFYTMIRSYDELPWAVIYINAQLVNAVLTTHASCVDFDIHCLCIRHNSSPITAYATSGTWPDTGTYLLAPQTTRIRMRSDQTNQFDSAIKCAKKLSGKESINGFNHDTNCNTFLHNQSNIRFSRLLNGHHAFCGLNSFV